jgi:ankyrin repeat protein
MERTPALVAAAERGDTAELARLLDRAPDPEIRGSGGLTALMRAAARGSLPALELLLARGAAPDATDDFGNTAFMYACARGQANCAARLAAAGANRAHAHKYGLGAADWLKWAKDGAAIEALVVR